MFFKISVILMLTLSLSCSNLTHLTSSNSDINYEQFLAIAIGTSESEVIRTLGQPSEKTTLEDFYKFKYFDLKTGLTKLIVNFSKNENKNPHFIGDSSTYIDSNLGISILYDKQNDVVQAVGRFDKNIRIPAAKKPIQTSTLHLATRPLTNKSLTPSIYQPKGVSL